MTINTCEFNFHHKLIFYQNRFFFELFSFACTFFIVWVVFPQNFLKHIHSLTERKLNRTQRCMRVSRILRLLVAWEIVEHTLKWKRGNQLIFWNSHDTQKKHAHIKRGALALASLLELTQKLYIRRRITSPVYPVATTELFYSALEYFSICLAHSYTRRVERQVAAFCAKLAQSNCSFMPMYIARAKKEKEILLAITIVSKCTVNFLYFSTSTSLAS